MRRLALACLVLAGVFVMSGVGIAEVPTSCGTLYPDYEPGVAFKTPEEALADVLAAVPSSDIEVPDDLSEGVTELGQYGVVAVEATPAGFVIESLRECETTRVLAFGFAWAHNPDVYVNPFSGNAADFWGGAHPDIDYHFTQEVPAAHEARIKAGIETWDSVNMDLTMTQGGQRSNSEVDFDCPVNNEIHYENIGTQAIGLTLVCEGSAGNIISLEMGVDKRGYYYTGADPAGINPPNCGGTGEPACEYDIQSLATHEFGHALGIGHLDSGGGCPAGGGAATMCLANGVGFGETFTRTLEDHDRDTITPLYP